MTAGMLPIEVVPGRTLTFRWRQTVDTPVGKKVVQHEGALPPSVEQAVATLVGVAKQLFTDNMVMRGSLNMTVDRLGGTVEGEPTHDGNFLQRVDELVALEASHKEAEKAEVAYDKAARPDVPPVPAKKGK